MDLFLNSIDNSWKNIQSNHQKLQAIVNVIGEYGNDDGSHHKQWLLNVILYISLGEDEFIEYVESQDYEYDFGTPP